MPEALGKNLRFESDVLWLDTSREIFIITVKENFPYASMVSICTQCSSLISESSSSNTHLTCLPYGKECCKMNRAVEIYYSPHDLELDVELMRSSDILACGPVKQSLWMHVVSFMGNHYNCICIMKFHTLNCIILWIGGSKIGPWDSIKPSDEKLGLGIL